MDLMAGHRAKAARSCCGVNDTTRRAARRSSLIKNRASDRKPTNVDGFQEWSAPSHRSSSSLTVSKGEARVTARCTA